MVLVMDDPPSLRLPPSEGDAVPLSGTHRAPWAVATQQDPREGDIDAGGDVDLVDLEAPTRSLPGEEVGPLLTVRGETANAIVGRRDVERDHVLGAIGRYGGEVSVLDCGGLPNARGGEQGGIAVRATSEDVGWWNSSPGGRRTARFVAGCGSGAVRARAAGAQARFT